MKSRKPGRFEAFPHRSEKGNKAGEPVTASGMGLDGSGCPWPVMANSTTEDMIAGITHSWEVDPEQLSPWLICRADAWQLHRAGRAGPQGEGSRAWSSECTCVLWMGRWVGVASTRHLWE